MPANLPETINGPDGPVPSEMIGSFVVRLFGKATYGCAGCGRYIPAYPEKDPSIVVSTVDKSRSWRLCVDCAPAEWDDAQIVYGRASTWANTAGWKTQPATRAEIDTERHAVEERRRVEGQQAPSRADESAARERQNLEAIDLRHLEVVRASSLNAARAATSGHANRRPDFDALEIHCAAMLSIVFSNSDAEWIALALAAVARNVWGITHDDAWSAISSSLAPGQARASRAATNLNGLPSFAAGPVAATSPAYPHTVFSPAFTRLRPRCSGS